MAREPNVKVLHFLMMSIGAMLGGSAGRALGGVGAALGIVFGSMLFWSLSRLIARKLF
ncbi:MAG TPA: hypothetical protein VNL98_10655 [Gemmatimonadales bacterium]|nr:hypothetical protein [Gemmatimonadales bacterium]